VHGEETRFSHVFFSDDHGRSWQLGGSSDAWTNECQAVELVDGTVMLNMRNLLGTRGGQPEMGGRRALAFSTDGGLTWSPRRLDDTLIEPVCQASLIVYSATPPARSRLLFSNPASSESRVRMTVRMSYDEGGTWSVAKVLHEGPAAYSSLCRLPDGDIGCLYECGESRYAETVTFARFSLDWLTDGEDRGVGRTG
jgi:sialidase-1